MITNYTLYDKSLSDLEDKKMLITTLNAHSYNVSGRDDMFAESLLKSDVLIPDGVSVVFALKWIKGLRLKKIAGADLFFYEMDRMQEKKGKVFFLGSSQATLDKMITRAQKEYPDVTVEGYSPPYKKSFSDEENAEMIARVNAFAPDVLFIGMTAPKQEKWAFQFKSDLNTRHIGCIGAVFDFYAGTVKRAPSFMISLGLEWLYRLCSEPKRLWKRYIVGNTIFILSMIKQKLRR